MWHKDFRLWFELHGVVEVVGVAVDTHIYISFLDEGE